MSHGTKDRSSIIVPGQWDKLRILLPREKPGQDFDLLPWDRPGQDFDSMSRPGPGRRTKPKRRFLLLPLSWDNGTRGQGFCFVPGQMNNRTGTSRDCPVPLEKQLVRPPMYPKIGHHIWMFPFVSLQYLLSGMATGLKI